MKRSILFILTLIAATVLVAGNCQHGKVDPAKKDDCCAWKKDANIEVVNLDNGAKVTIIAENADTVKAIQAQFAEMAKGGCKHGQEEAKAEAKPADAKGGCMHGKDEAKGKDCCAWKKDAKIDVANEKNGVVVTITTAKKDEVKAIQEHAAMMSKGGCMHHGDMAEVKAGCKHGEGEGMGMAWKKDAKFEVANLDNGAKMTVTSDKEEAVKAIQDHFAQMGKDCPMKDKLAWHKDAKMEVVNQPKGASLTVTTEKKDDVKAIQEHFAAMSKGDCCKGMKDGKGCKHGQEKAQGGCKHGEEKKADTAKCPHAEKSN